MFPLSYHLSAFLPSLLQYLFHSLFTRSSHWMLSYSMFHDIIFNSLLRGLYQCSLPNSITDLRHDACTEAWREAGRFKGVWSEVSGVHKKSREGTGRGQGGGREGAGRGQGGGREGAGRGQGGGREGAGRGQGGGWEGAGRGREEAGRVKGGEGRGKAGVMEGEGGGREGSWRGKGDKILIVVISSFLICPRKLPALHGIDIVTKSVAWSVTRSVRQSVTRSVTRSSVGQAVSHTVGYTVSHR